MKRVLNLMRNPCNPKLAHILKLSTDTEEFASIEGTVWKGVHRDR